MAKKIFTYKGRTVEELKTMDLKELSTVLPSRLRRHIKRGFTDKEKNLLKKIRSKKSNIETHCREMIVLPEMIGMTIKVHSGKEFQPVIITEDMIGHVLGEFAQTRRRVQHNAPGIGATKSSGALSVR